MIEKLRQRGLIRIILLACLSLVAGGINGFVGTGGGIVFIYALSLLTSNDKRDSLATTLFATLPISLVASISYFRSGNVDLSVLSEIFIPTILGGITGAFLVSRLKVEWLNIIFAILVIYGGVSFLVR
ncbi:MAG: sulfite exporter TauE/SafE family protein [Clostridia bacterium]|nr:sulfite exporter TauE/SafE family protein [Clostridia bacterium]